MRNEIFPLQLKPSLVVRVGASISTVPALSMPRLRPDLKVVRKQRALSAKGFSIGVRTKARLAKALPTPHFSRMQSHELLREVFHSASPKQIAADLKLSLSMIYKWAEPPEETAGSGAANPLDRIEALIKSTQDERLLQWICQKGGGFFIRNPKLHHPHPDYLIPATNEIIQEFADLLAVVANAAADNQISPDEAKKIRARWEELKTVTECFVRCCEEGNFRSLRDRPPTLHPPSQTEEKGSR